MIIHSVRLDKSTYKLYILNMSTAEMSSTDARNHFADVVGRAQHGGVTTAITSHGKRVAAVVPAEVLDLLDELEDRGLSRMAREAKAEAGEPVDHAALLAEFDQR
ncbi:type II toxin-antitoxin system Phd/YefM family antitoxin [Pseudonocardia sp. EV170527-09]|nr:type II toxin-antitoxin system Phd/YefM family antitoxin [Pseudonocardia sp. EV170527-09]